MKKTDDGRGFLIYRCRNCGEEFYSDPIYENVDGIFDAAVRHYRSAFRYSSHDCNSDQTGFADLVAYTGMIKIRSKEERDKDKEAGDI